MDNTKTVNANRQARFRATLQEQGIKPLSLLAPAEVHDIIREFARRTREGEEAERVLGSLYRQASGKASPLALPALAVPDNLQPGPGEVALAVRLCKDTAGHVKKLVRASGLLRSEVVGAWVGVLPATAADDITKRVLAGGGNVAERRGE